MRLSKKVICICEAVLKKEYASMTVSILTVMILAACVWYSGGIALLLKGGALAKSAYALQPDNIWTFLTPLLGILIGLVKAKFIFIKSCTKNIVRIKALENPKLWQCFRPGMLVFLAIIIPTGAWMSRAAAGTYLYVCIVCALDLSICTGLLVSSMLFWRLKAFSAVRSN
jgi:hypothetical protein